MSSHQPPPPRLPKEALLAVALVSFCILAAEVALTRVFSVLFRAPYVFLIISGAIGGLGFGGLLVQWMRPSEERMRAAIVALSVLLAGAVAAPVVLLFALPWGRALVSGAETLVVVAIPMLTFSLAGMLLSLVFRQYSESGGHLYFADLAAAALAAPVSVLLLDFLGGINTPLALAVLAAASGLLLARSLRSRVWSLVALGTLVGCVGLLGTNLARPWISLPLLKMPSAAETDPTHPWHMSTKPLFQELGNPFSSARLVRTDWAAVARTDVVEEGRNTFYIYTDGDVPTQMMEWDGRLESARQQYGQFIGMLPYRLLQAQPESVMAIGSGGGLDVLLARAAGASRIDAVEINPSIPKIVADPRFKGTYARVYQEPGVKLIVDEGRSHLQRSGKYDVIYFACAKTATTQTSGVALLDNHLYTVEAFRDYWDHLSERGMAALVTQEPVIIDRLLLTAMTALRREGLSPAEASARLLTAGVRDPRFSGPYRFILLVNRRAWLPADIASVRQGIEQTGLVPLYLPHEKPEGAFGAGFDPTGSLATIQRDLERQYPVSNGPNPVLANLQPVTDDRPFYADLARGLHPMLEGLLRGSVIATGVVVLAVLLCAAWLLRPRAGGNSTEGPRPSPGLGLLVAGKWIFYFAMLGGGFMLVELALMHQFMLLLGFPTRSLTVTLFALLVSSALGSRCSQAGSTAQSARRLLIALPILVLLLLAYRAFLPSVLTSLLPQPLWVRVAATVVLLFPAGFVMGMPFPTALRSLSGSYGQLIPAFWSVNGVTSILGSVGTMALAKFHGYSGVLLLGCACYVGAWLAWAISAGRSSKSGPAASTASTVSPT